MSGVNQEKPLNTQKQRQWSSSNVVDVDNTNTGGTWQRLRVLHKQTDKQRGRLNKNTPEGKKNCIKEENKTK